MSLRELFTDLDHDSSKLSKPQLETALEQVLIKLGRTCDDFESDNSAGVQILCNDRDQMRMGWLIAGKISNLDFEPSKMVEMMETQCLKYPIRIYMPKHGEAAWDDAFYNAFPELKLADINELAKKFDLSLVMLDKKA